MCFSSLQPGSLTKVIQTDMLIKRSCALLQPAAASDLVAESQAGRAKQTQGLLYPGSNDPSWHPLSGPPARITLGD